MSSFHSSFRNREEDVWIDGFKQGLASNNNDLMFNSLETSNKFVPQEEANVDHFVPQENANIDHFVPQENENAEQFVPPVDQFETREEPRMMITTRT